MVKSVLHSLNPSTLCSILSFVLLFSTISVVTSSKDGCSHSCGQLENITPPFHLKGDPDHCGDPKYELICEGNRTILSYFSGKYYILNISTTHHDEMLFTVVNVGLSSGQCNDLPSKFPVCQAYRSYLNNETQFEYYINNDFLAEGICVTLINCTSIIQNDSYQEVPCMSRNGTYVYVTSNITVKNLEPSCGVLAMIPTDENFNEKSDRDVFQQLQKGFTFRWTRSGIRNQISLGSCFFSYFRYNEAFEESELGIAYTLRRLIFIRVTSSESRYYLLNFIQMYIYQQIALAMCIWEQTKAFIGVPIALAFLVLFHFLVILLVKKIILAPMLVCGFLTYEYLKNSPVNAVEKFLQNQLLLTPTRYTYNEIITITSHFKEKLGQGGFGSVFKGKLPHGQLVAVKILGNSNGNGDDFINEVSTIGRIHHKNVVRLLGFCSEGSNRALIYEYMPNGSLDKYIFSSSNITTHRPFTWDKLNDIASSVAQGIDYLHRGCDMRILHFDIKPHNILLDQRFNPKVSDFGLAKLYPRDYSMVSFSAARGTIGYIAPELVSRSFGVISHKSDVYSYGMLLLEMAGGRRNVNPRAEHSSQIYYPSWIYDRLNQTEGIEVDNNAEICEAERVLRTEINEVERKLCKVGLWCIQMKPPNRPSMSEVLDMLEADAYDLPMPPKPFVSSSQPTSVRTTCLDSSPSELSTISEYE